MPSSSAPAAAKPVEADNERLRAALEARPVNFLIRTGSNKWSCTLQHRNSYERQKATRTDSAASVSTASSSSSTTSH